MALAQEVAWKGITVNTVSPGYIATDMGLAVPEESAARSPRTIPIGRMGPPEELAYVVNFLASTEAGLFNRGQPVLQRRSTHDVRRLRCRGAAPEAP